MFTGRVNIPNAQRLGNSLGGQNSGSQGKLNRFNDLALKHSEMVLHGEVICGVNPLESMS